MSMESYKVLRDGPVARVVLTNPDKHNAFDDGLIKGLIGAFLLLEEADDIRVIILEAEGKSFSAGADLNWMKRMADYSHEENIEDATMLGRLMETINFLSKPVVAKVAGAAYGGGVGLVACCDIAIGTDRARFCLSEVKLGLIPAVISPYVVAAIGARAARRYFLTAEVMDASEAARLGLLHDVVPADALDATVDAVVAALLRAGPESLRDAKDLIFAVNRPIEAAVIGETVERIARVRASDEARQGIAAFFEKRDPPWTKTS